MPESAVVGVHATDLTYILELLEHDCPRVFLQMATLSAVLDFFPSTCFITIDQLQDNSLPREWMDIKGRNIISAKSLVLQAYKNSLYD